MAWTKPPPDQLIDCPGTINGRPCGAKVDRARFKMIGVQCGFCGHIFSPLEYREALDGLKEPLDYSKRPARGGYF